VNLTTRKRGLASLVLVGASALVLAGCGAAPEPEESDPAASDFLACAVSDEGDFEDASFNQAAYEGLEKAEDELGVKIEGLTSASLDAFEPNLTQLVDDKCDIIFAIGFNFSLGGTNGIIFDFAEAHPDNHFAWLDGWPGPDNLKAIVYQSEQGAYLGGYAAAAYSTTHIIGTYGGLQIDSVTAFMDGYVQGAAAYDAEFGTTTTVLG
jgi:basic membrane protein A